MRGPKPKPNEQRIKEGNLAKRPVPETVLLGGRPDLEEMREPPPGLPPEAQEFWTETVLDLVNVGLVDRVDVPVLKQLAIQYARIAQAQRVLAEQGHYVRGSVGQLRPHPALKIEQDATALFMKMAEHYGLTPVARTRLGLAELQRRSLKQELEKGLRPAKLKPILTDEDGDEISNIVDAEVVA